MSLKLIVNGFNVEVKTIGFSDGASNLFIDPQLMPAEPEYYTVLVEPSTRINDIYAELKHFIDIMERDWPQIQRRHLYLHYLPDGRADRPFTKGYAFPLQVFINDMIFHFTEVTIVDPHNPDAVRSIISRMVPVLGMNLIPKVNIVSQAEVFSTLYRDTHCFGVKGDICLISPDKGAVDKTNAIKEALGNDCDAVLYFNKERDVHTGHITSIDIVNERDAFLNAAVLKMDGGFRQYVVVDDICDGGGTFIPIAIKIKQLLEKHGVPNTQYRIVLFVTHGIFSKGISGLDVFDAIYTNHIVANYVTKDEIAAFNKRIKTTIQE